MWGERGGRESRVGERERGGELVGREREGGVSGARERGK